jgi:glucoamylase
MKKILSALVFLLIVTGIQPASAGGTYWQDGDYERICLTMGWTDCAVWRIVDSNGVEKNRVIGPGSYSVLSQTCGPNFCGGGESATAIKLETLAPIATPSSTPAPESSTAPSSTPTSESSTAPIPTPTPTATRAPTAEPRGLGGYAVIHPDGYVCGVIVGNSYFGNNDRTMTSEFMGCPLGSAIIFQTKPSPSGNVAGWHGTNVTYSGGVFTIKNGTQVAMTITDGIATDSSGRVWDTGSGETLRAAPVLAPTAPILSDTTTATSETKTVTTAPSSGSAPSSGTVPSGGGSETTTTSAVIGFETTTAMIPVAIPPAENDLSTLDEITPEEEIIDSIDAAVQSNGTTRIEVSTGYNSTAMRVVASKKGSKKRYTYRITTNSVGERIFRASLNLRGFTLVLIRGSTELDRIIVS